MPLLTGLKPAAKKGVIMRAGTDQVNRVADRPVRTYLCQPDAIRRRIPELT